MDLIGTLYGLLSAGLDPITVLVAYWLVVDPAQQRADAEGLSTDAVANAGTWLGVGALVVGRLAYAAPDWPTFVRYPLDLLRVQNGVSFYGGLVGGLIVLGWYARRGRLPLARALDLFAPYLAVGVAAYRVGCLVRGDCFGAAAPPPFGVVFPGLTQPRYPAELYEAVLVLGLAALLFYLRERPRVPATLGLAFLILYPLVRAGVDVARINLNGWPTGNQVASLAVAVVAAVLLAMRIGRGSAQSIVEFRPSNRAAFLPPEGDMRHTRHTSEGG